MVQWTGHIPAGKVDDRPVISLDLLPTAVSVAGGKAAANVDGVDLMPYLTGEKAGSPHEALYWRYGKDSAIRMGDWKLARREGKGTHLFNLASDPSEAKDLASENPEKVKELSAAWEKWNAGNVAPLWPALSPGPWEEMFW
jgi:arylsulfatase A-like enzyme